MIATIRSSNQAAHKNVAWTERPDVDEATGGGNWELQSRYLKEAFRSVGLGSTVGVDFNPPSAAAESVVAHSSQSFSPLVNVLLITHLIHHVDAETSASTPSSAPLAAGRVATRLTLTC